MNGFEEWCVIRLVFYCLTAWIKKGFTNLKYFDSGFGLAIGLAIGLVNEF